MTINEILSTFNTAETHLCLPLTSSQSYAIQSWIYKSLRKIECKCPLVICVRRTQFTFQYRIDLISNSTGKSIKRTWIVNMSPCWNIQNGELHYVGPTGNTAISSIAHLCYGSKHNVIETSCDLNKILDRMVQHLQELDKLHLRNISSKINNDNDAPRKILFMMYEKAIKEDMDAISCLQKELKDQPYLIIRDRHDLRMIMEIKFSGLEATIRIFTCTDVRPVDVNVEIAYHKFNLCEPGVDPDKFLNLIDVLKDMGKIRDEALSKIANIDIIGMLKGI